MACTPQTRILRVSVPLGHDDEGAIKECARILRTGGLVAFPTETVYGLGALAQNDCAVRRIFWAKRRPEDNPLIVHISDMAQLESLAEHIPPSAHVLAQKFWPGPLSLVLRSSKNVAASVSAGLDTVAVRMPKNEVALRLIQQVGPIAAPSANASGRPSPTTAGHVKSDLDGRIEAILDGGPCEVGLESTVVDLSSGVPSILRPGGVTKERLLPYLPGLQEHSTQAVHRPRSPGQKYTHYSPRAPLVLIKGQNAATTSWRLAQEANKSLIAGNTVGVLCTQETGAFYRDMFERVIHAGKMHVLEVGSGHNAGEIAARLFDTLRRFDGLEVDEIFAESIEEADIGVAIMDRLGRAAARRLDADAHQNITCTVLFLCTGNTCRSPMAKAIAYSEAEKAGLYGGLEFVSAGLLAQEGLGAAGHAIQVAKTVGVGLESHRTRRVTEQMVEEADLILTMTRAHLDALLRGFGGAYGKAYTLADYDVPDPYGGSYEDYSLVAAALKEHIAPLIQKIKASGGKCPGSEWRP